MLLVLAAGSATAYIYPTVAFSFDPGTYAYKYTVTVTPQDSFPLGYLELDTLVKNLAPNAWTMIGPVAGAVDANWSKTWWEWAPGCDAANWYVDQLQGQQEIFPSNWVGEFTLIAPNTVPGDGFGLTMDGDEWSVNPFTVLVPGPTVPEPSSVAALGLGLLGTGSMLLRRRKI